METTRPPLFSLVMCLYDVEDYVLGAVRSIRGQDFDDWELILVDDGARDKSVLRALRGAGDDPRVRFVHNDHNLGLAEARNRGLEQARGRYVAFPDAEDTADRVYLSLAAEAIQAEDPDMVVQGLREDHYNRRGEVAYSDERVPQATVARGDEVQALALPLEEARLMASVFTKFFRRSLVGDLRFHTEPAHSLEDFSFNLAMLERSRTVVVQDVTPYCFEKHLRLVRHASRTRGVFLQRHARIAALQAHQEAHGLDSAESRGRLGALYASHIIDELGRLSDPETDVPKSQREAWVSFLHEDPLFQMLVLGTEPTPGLLRSLFHKALTANGTSAALTVGHLVGYLKSFGPDSYSRASD